MSLAWRVLSLCCLLLSIPAASPAASGSTPPSRVSGAPLPPASASPAASGSTPASRVSGAPLPPASALSAFNASLQGELVVPSSAGYANASAEWNRRVSSARPYAVVFAAADGDVASSLAFARTWALRVALRSGRHQVEGWSVCTGCLVIDVSRGYAGVAVAPDQGTVDVGAGASIGALLNATVPLGVHVPSGSCSSVGVAGYVLGGGIGWTSRLFGLAVDSLLGARIMLGNGSVVAAARGGPHAELLWALSGGGGGNFGVALTLTLALHPLPPRLLYAEYAFPWRAAANATAAYLALRAEPRFLFYCLFVRPAAAAEPAVLLQGIWLGDLAAGRAALAPLTALAAAANSSGDARASVIVTDYLTAHALFEGPLGVPTANKQKSAFAALDATVAAPAALDIVRAALVAAPPDVAENSAVYLNSMGGAINAVAANATAFPHRNALLNFVVDAHWVRSESTPAGLAWTRALYAEVAAAGVLGGSGGMPLPTYVNYADADLAASEWPVAYFGAANYARLQAVKQAYDAAGVFSFPQAIEVPAAPPTP